MIRAETVTNYLGESKRFELAFPEESGFAVQSISGLGPSKADINTTEISTNDGSLYNSARVNSRNIVMSLKLMFNPQIEDTRHDSYKYFPIKKKVTLLIETDNRICETCASIKGRGISHQRDRFEVHLRKYYRLYGNEGWILFGDFSKFYDNIIHEIAKRELLKLFDDDEFIDWLLTQIFDGFKIDVSYMTDEEYATCMSDTFNKLDYRNIPESKLTGEKWMEKSVNIGDQLSQVIGIYYPYRIDNYVKYVRSQKFYGRYMDDWYIMNPSKEELFDLLDHIHQIAEEYGIHINKKKTRIVKISSTYKFLQIKYSLTDSGKVIKRINPKRVTTMRRKLKKLAVKVKNEEITYENVENMFRGWMGSFYKLLSKEQRKNLIGLYEDLFEKSITIISKRMIITDKIK